DESHGVKGLEVEAREDHEDGLTLLKSLSNEVILGEEVADPKPFPPPMKLFKDMVETMGGAERLLNHDDTKEENIAMDELEDGILKLFKVANFEYIDEALEI
nr:hypothetical protein [Tanacetum cinerariifolium]